MSKGEIRRQALAARRAIPKARAIELSAAIAQSVVALPEYASSGLIATYVAKDDEVQTRDIISKALASGKRVLVPRSHVSSSKLTFHEISSLEELSPGSFGILEPPPGSVAVPLNQAQLVLVPVVAWDETGQRVGYGKGFFDRALSEKGETTATGLAFESQRRVPIPADQSDIGLDILVTEKRVLRFGGRAHA